MQRKALTIRLKSKSDQKYPKKLPTKLFTKFDASLTASEQNNHTTGSHTTATEVTDNDTSPKSTNEQTPSVSYDYKNSGQRITDQHIERKQSAPLVHEPSRTRTLSCSFSNLPSPMNDSPYILAMMFFFWFMSLLLFPPSLSGESLFFDPSFTPLTISFRLACNSPINSFTGPL